MTVYVVTGYNGLLKAYGPVGVAKTPEGAEAIKKAHDYMLDEVLISEMELES